MSRAVVLFSIVLLAGYVAGNLIRNDNVTTKDVKIADELIKENPTTLNEVEKNNVETPAEVLGTGSTVKCAEIGQMCTFHGECCSNACLGYLKRCVSGSG